MTEQWWLCSKPFLRLSPIHNRQTLAELTAMLPQIAADGFGAIDLFPPYYGGCEYGGLDAIDFYGVHPGVGTLSELRRFIESAHNLGLKVIAFLNLGYCSMNHADFHKACLDVKNGVQSKERELFLWSDKPFPMEKPLAPYFLQDSHGEWARSEEAGQYYWCKWFGQKGDVRLPQYCFGSEHWRSECVSILRFWRQQGFDGFIMDAVNWYTDCDWNINRQAIIEPACEEGAVLLQPEGAGGFKDDPVPWITQGHYNCVQDYSLALWWEGVDLIGDCLRTKDVSALWEAIRGYRDRVCEAGGVTYMGLGQGECLKRDAETALFELGLLVAIGQIINYNYVDWRRDASGGIRELFRLQAAYPALAAAAKRVPMETVTDRAVFAVRCPGEKGEQAVSALFNFGEKVFETNISSLGSISIRASGFVFYTDDGKLLSTSK